MKKYLSNKAGKINKRKGLPSRFPMYIDGSTVGTGLLSGANAGLDAGTSSSIGNNINYLKLVNPAMNLLSAFKQPTPEEYMGTNAYFDKQNQLTGQNAALTNAVSRGLSFIPGWGQAASLGLQAAKVAGDLIGQKDQYGVAGSGAQQIASGILDPIGSINSMAQGQNPFSRKQKMGQVSNLYKDFSSDKTAQEQDAYTQSMKAQEGAYLEYGGLMHFASGGRMVNPYNGQPNAEIEGEVVNHANGGIQDFTYLPNHEQATEANEMMLEPNTFIFSKRFNNPITGRPFATDAKRYTTASEEKIFNNKNAPAITAKSAKLMFGVKKQLAENLAELHEATKLHNGAQKAENEATEEFIGMLGGMYGKGGLIKRKDGSYSPRGLWDNIRANRGSGKKPTKAMLEQERKIKAKYANGGTYLTVGDEYHKVYRNAEGDIMVNHPKEDKGKWDTINLTDKAGAKTVAQGVAATKKWHRENPYAYGGYALGESYNMTDEEIKELKKQGYTFDIE